MRKGPQNETVLAPGPDLDRQQRSATLPFARAAAEGGVGGVPCVTLGRVPLAMDTLTWRMGPSLRLTVVIKTQFSVSPLAAQGPSAPTPTATAPRFFPADVHARNQPMAHVTAASDRVPWKMNVDVTLIGHACAPFARPAPEVGLRFAALEGSHVHFQKKARALGKRVSLNAAPEPFVKQPVVYERAYGGPTTLTNPIGTGDDEDDAPPNIVDPDDARRPAVFGPVAAGWPIRQRKLGRVKRPELEQAIVALPGDFDVSYFQSAPVDQQVPALGPSTYFVLEGFHAERPRVDIALPKARLFGAVWGLSAQDPQAFPLTFRMDTLHIDADNWLCTVIYRAYADVSDEAALGRMIVAAGVGMDGEVVALPERRPEPDGAAAAGGLRPAPTRVATGTMAIGTDAPAPKTLPFAEQAADLGATMALPAGAALASLPFFPSAVAPPPVAHPPVAHPPVAQPPAAPATVPMPSPDADLPPTPETPAPPAMLAAPVEAPLPPTHPLDFPPAPRVEPPPPPVLAPLPLPVTAPVIPAMAASEAPPPAAPKADPYGQAMPWARGADDGETSAPAAPKPKLRAERKFTLRKGFHKR